MCHVVQPRLKIRSYVRHTSVAVHFGTYTTNYFANNYHPKIIETVLPNHTQSIFCIVNKLLFHCTSNERFECSPRVYVLFFLVFLCVCVFFLHGRRFITLCAVTCIVKIIYYPCETYNHDCIIVVTLIGAPKR